MLLERTAAYILAVMCVFQALLPSWAIKIHSWRSIDVQIGRLRMQARNEINSACFDELAAEQKACAEGTQVLLVHSWHKEPERLTICINDSDCITARLDGTSHGWMISKDEIEKSTSRD